MRSWTQRVRERVAGLPQAYWFLWAGTLVNRMGGFVAPFLSLYLTQERGLGVAAVGQVVASLGAGAVLAGPVGGALADRLGRRRTMLLALTGSALLMLALGQARTLPQLAACAFLLGFLNDMYRPAMQAMVADVVPPHDRLRAFALLYWAVNLGYSVAMPVAGAVAGLSFRALFLGDAATTLACAAVLAWRVPESRPAAPPPASPEGRAPPQAGGFGALLADRVFLSFVGLQFLLGAMFFQTGSTLPLQLRAQGLSTEQFGRVMMVNGVLIVALQPLLVSLAHRVRRSHVLAAAGLLTGAGFWLHGQLTGAGGHALAVALWTLGEIANAPVASSVVADLAPAHARGRYQGVFTMSWSLGMLAAPLGGALVLEAWGPAALWGGCLGLGAVLLAGHLAIAGARQRRVAALRGGEGSPLLE